MGVVATQVQARVLLEPAAEHVGLGNDPENGAAAVHHGQGSETPVGHHLPGRLRRRVRPDGDD